MNVLWGGRIINGSFGNKKEGDGRFHVCSTLSFKEL